MEKFLIDYLEQPNKKSKGMSNDSGPVVTISRECGCSSNNIAIKLSKILSGYSFEPGGKNTDTWKWVNKEIIEKTAIELEMHPEKVKDVFLKEAKNSLHEVTTAFSTEKVYDADDQMVIDTVTDVITRLAEKGRCVIVGRAAFVITNKIPASLNVRLQAPLEWRIKRIMKVSNLNYSDARDYVMEVDRQRNLFVEHLSGRKMDYNDFDIVFNCATLSENQIVTAIINLLKSKNIILTA